MGSGNGRSQDEVCYQLPCLAGNWQAETGIIHDEMLINKMTYRKAIKDKDRQNMFEISNDLHDCLIKKDMNNFWKSWNNKFKVRNSKINVDGLSSDSEIAAEFANLFEGICSVEESDYVTNSKNTFLNLFTKNEVYSICEPQYQVSIELVEEVIIGAKFRKSSWN